MGGAGVVDAFRRLRPARASSSCSGTTSRTSSARQRRRPTSTTRVPSAASGWARPGFVSCCSVCRRQPENLQRLAELIAANAEAEQQELMWAARHDPRPAASSASTSARASNGCERNGGPTACGCRTSTGAGGGGTWTGARFRRLRPRSRRRARRLGDVASARDRRGRSDQLAAGRRQAAATRPDAADPDSVVPRRAGHRLDRRPRGSTRILLLGAASSAGARGRCAKGPGSATARRATATRCSCCSRGRATRVALRARAFAMHALAQVERTRMEYGRGRYTLWTGDAGAALYLADCLDGTPRLPLP